MIKTEYKEKPIICSSEMVRAILEDRKTQDRRVIKQQIKKELYPGELLEYCPYGQADDRLWVRESWRVESFMDGEPLLFSYKDGQTMEENDYSDTLNYENWYERICTQSTEDAEKAFKQGLVRQDEGDIYRWDIGKSPCRWCSPRFMPRWASRITLEIINVKVERLQEISVDDIDREGCLTDLNGKYTWFMDLWDSLNAKRGYGWEVNPWVWVVEFKRLK